MKKSFPRCRKRNGSSHAVYTIPMTAKKSKDAVIYQAKSGAIELRGDATHETVWATQAQIAEVFQVERSVVTKHIGNVLRDREIDEKSNVQKMHIANSDKPVTVYSLDIILSVGYRTNSKKATEFRQWATKTLRGYIVDGYALDKSRIAKNHAQFLQVVEDIKRLLPAGSATESKDVVELISLFADTWLSLDAYDKEQLPKGKLTKKAVKLTADKITDNLTQLKQSLLEGNQATDIFGRERSEGSVSGIVGNVMQSFGGKELYPTAEEKVIKLILNLVSR